jgi:hypothetical protein
MFPNEIFLIIFTILLNDHEYLKLRELRLVSKSFDKLVFTIVQGFCNNMKFKINQAHTGNIWEDVVTNHLILSMVTDNEFSLGFDYFKSHKDHIIKYDKVILNYYSKQLIPLGLDGIFISKYTILRSGRKMLKYRLHHNEIFINFIKKYHLDKYYDYERCEPRKIRDIDFIFSIGSKYVEHDILKSLIINIW